MFDFVVGSIGLWSGILTVLAWKHKEPQLANRAARICISAVTLYTLKHVLF